MGATGCPAPRPRAPPCPSPHHFVKALDQALQAQYVVEQVPQAGLHALVVQQGLAQQGVQVRVVGLDQVVQVAGGRDALAQVLAAGGGSAVQWN